MRLSISVFRCQCIVCVCVKFVGVCTGGGCWTNWSMSCARRQVDRCLYWLPLSRAAVVTRLTLCLCVGTDDIVGAVDSDDSDYEGRRVDCTCIRNIRCVCVLIRC
jgi:hypothetical protein